MGKRYKRVYMPESPMAQADGRVLEHRLVAAEKEGVAALRPDQVVHHVNGDRSDNRPENLEVMTASEHMRLHRLQSQDFRGNLRNQQPLAKKSRAA
jgi:hypothetical protein